jgi:hypothetical protein
MRSRYSSVRADELIAGAQKQSWPSNPPPMVRRRQLVRIEPHEVTVNTCLSLCSICFEVSAIFAGASIPSAMRYTSASQRVVALGYV